MSGCGCGGTCGGCGDAAPLVAAAPQAAPKPEKARPQRDTPGVSQLLSSERKAWCGTGFVDDGRLTASSQFVPSIVPPGTPMRLTPFGAYPLVAGQPDTLAVFETADRYHKLRKAVDTGRLVPRGSFVLRPDPKTALEAGGSVFVGEKQRLKPAQPTAIQWAQVPATIRTGARAQGFHPPPDSSQIPDGVLLTAGENTAATPWLPEGHVLDLVGPAVDPCACAGTLECSLANKVILDYAGYRLCVPETWFWRHYEDDTWMSVNDTMAVLWNGVNGHGTPVSSDVMDTLLGCWMIDTDNDSHGRSYSMFFNDGNGPRKFLHYALDLVRRFSDEIKDEWSGVTTCSGLRGYIEDVLDGEKGSTKTSGVGPCTLNFRAVSETTWLPNTTTNRYCGEEHERVDCGTASGMGGAFDDWSQVLDHSYSEPVGATRIYTMKVKSGLPANWSEPEADYLGYTSPASGAVQVPANRLAFRGYQFDFTMFWARVALEYAYKKADWTAWYAAWVYTRAAQSYIVEYGRMLVHEMGHAHMGQGGHCKGDDGLTTACCFDIAAEHWKCRVSSLLGLPDIGKLTCTSDPLSGTTSNPCGGEGEGEYPMVCSRGALCSVDDAFFWAGPCA